MACVGCGRCAAVCHGDIGMPSVVEMIRRATAATEGMKATMNPPRRHREHLPAEDWPCWTGWSDDIPEVKTFYWHFEDAAEQAKFKRFRPGQFAQVSLFGVGRVPRLAAAQPDRGRRPSSPSARSAVARPPSTSSSPATSSPCAAPTATASRWRSTTGKNLVFVAGGIGLIPLRSCIVYALEHRDKYQRIQIFYGSKTPRELMYVPNLREWQQSAGVECYLTVDRAARRLERQRGRGGQPVQEARRAGAGGEHDRFRLRPADHVPLRHQGPAGDGLRRRRTSSRPSSAT